MRSRKTRAPFSPPGARRAVAWLASGFLAALGAARLAETVHYLTDVLAGAATGLAVTLAAALGITAGWRTRRARDDQAARDRSARGAI